MVLSIAIHQVFLSYINNLHKAAWFQISNDNNPW